MGKNLQSQRELSKKYKSTDKDETKAEIMSYMDLREILGLNVDLIEQLLHASNCDLVAKYESLGLPPDPTRNFYLEHKIKT